MKIISNEQPKPPPSGIKWALAFGIYCAGSGFAFYVARALTSLGVSNEGATGLGAFTGLFVGAYLFRLFVLED